MNTLENPYCQLIYKGRLKMIWIHLKKHPDQIDKLKNNEISVDNSLIQHIKNLPLIYGNHL